MTEERLHTLSIFTENSPGVLHRLTVLFTRRKLNIESLTVSETERKGISRFTLLVRCDESTIRKIAKQIVRIIEVLDVSVHADAGLHVKEIALFRVRADSGDACDEIERLVGEARAQLTTRTAHSLVIEKTGTEEEVNGLFKLLEPFGIREFVRSGRIAIMKESE